MSEIIKEKFVLEINYPKKELSLSKDGNQSIHELDLDQMCLLNLRYV